MGKKDLINQVARLETINDQLSSELKYLDQISRKLGFAEGLKTLKEAALELLEIEKRKEAIEEDDEDLQN
ncbi:MAG: hypothetical protein PVI40_07325 [Chlamydiota bacterium]|jgi:hypothetical protein